MNMQLLKKIVPLTLSAGMVLSVPALVPQAVPASLSVQAMAASKGVSWSFSKDLDDWKYGGKWAYKGKPAVAWSKDFGGTIRLDLDYSPTADQSWSEVKLEYGKVAEKPVSLAGCNVLTYDLYFNPKAMTAGSFKTKVYAKDTAGKEVINAAPDIDLGKAKDAGNGMKVVTVQVPFQPVRNAVNYLMFSIVGSNTDYKGAMYVGKVSAHYVKLPDGYVGKTAKVSRQQQVPLSELQIPAQVKLVDGKASERTAQVYAYMQGIADSKYLLYGHQNELHKKVSTLPGRSDTYDIVGDDAAVIGVDGLALTGDELDLTDAEKAAGVTYAQKLAGIIIPAGQRGAIITMSCHMPNFDVVSKKPKVNGQYDYSTYSPNVTSGDVVRRILPGGDLNPVFNGYLDKVADFAGRLQAANVPIVFRPFHENNGSWFWWGAAFCTSSEYKNLFRYTVEYLRDQKGLHNLIYAYSPNGPFASTEDYASRYPGDGFVDIAGFDIYHRDPAKGDDWMQGFDDTMKVVQQFAEEHHKLAAVTETGILVGNKGGALARTGNQRPDWFNEALHTIAPHKMAYFMTWSNFSEDNFDQPYLVTPKRGHEMVNQFIQFYNQPESVFAGQISDVSKLKVLVEPAMARDGYLTAPDAMTRILAPVTMKAKLTGSVSKVQFLLRRKDGTTATAIPASPGKGGLAEALLPEDSLSLLGATVGSVALEVDGQVTDQVPVLYNMPAPAPNPAVVDTFEHYYGDNGLLKGAYSTNCGSGCSIDLSLSTTHSEGETGLRYHYKLTKGGYAGIIKRLKGVDWSLYQGVQFWITPDGKGQKLICQLNSGGEDFEVDLTKVASGTAPQLVTIPFSQFKGKNGGRLDTAAIQHFALYCNAVGDAPVDSSFYFDDIRAVK